MSETEARNPGAQAIYRGTVSEGDLREDLTLMGDGHIGVSTRMRRRPVSAVRVVAAGTLALAGAVLSLLIALDIAPSIFLGGGFFFAFISGLAAMGAGIYALNRLYFKRRRFEARSSLDKTTLATIRRLKQSRSDVTRFLLDVAFASVRLERAEQAVATARERVRIAGSSERLDQVAERADEELPQAQAMKKAALARLVGFATEEEESAQGQWEKF